MSRDRRVAVTATGGRTSGRRRPAAGPVLPPEVLAAARRIRRAQLRRAAVLLVVGAVLLLSVPVLIRSFPALAEMRLFGVPGGWIVVAVLPYPAMVVLAFAHLAAAERVERGHPTPDADDLRDGP